MAKPLLPLLILFSCLAAAAQDKDQACPTITVRDPPGVLRPGDAVDFHLVISPATDGPLQLIWTVSAGIIEKGQGEATLTVRTDRSLDGEHLYAEVKIYGLPEKCPNTARNSAAVSTTRTPITIDEYAEQEANNEYARLDAVLQEISSNEGSVAVIVLNVGPEESEENVRSRLERIEGHIFGFRKFERRRVRFGFSRGLSSTTIIYRVPVVEADALFDHYADSSSLADLFATSCPNFSITGPAGIFQPDEPIVFTADIDGELPKSAKLVWSVNKGQIIEGWGTDRIVITVDEDTLWSSSGLVSLEIEGLPEGCQVGASETLPTIDFPEPVLIEEFGGVPVSDIARKRLADAVREGVNNPTNQIYIIEYFPPWTSEFDIREKIESIRRYIAEELKFDISHVTIVTAEGAALNTKIFRLPPGAENPKP